MTTFSVYGVALALLATVFGQTAGTPTPQELAAALQKKYNGISAFSALIVAAISRQHQQALATLKKNVAALKERERELSHLVDMLPIHIRRLTPEGAVAIDPTGKLAGRGAYLCRTTECWRRGLRAGSLSRALKAQISEADLAQLQDLASTIARESSSTDQQKPERQPAL